jgi:hypothetical protein
MHILPPFPTFAHDLSANTKSNSYEEEEYRTKEASDVYTSSKNQKLVALALEYHVYYSRDQVANLPIAGYLHS